jgi:hypothetical protein
MANSRFDIQCSLKSVLLGLALASFAQAQMKVVGRVVDQTGAPVAGIAISVIQVPSALSPRPRVYRATSARDGSYAVLALPGLYRICVEEAQGYLDPCQWQLGSTGVAVRASIMHSIVLQEGRPLSVRILDSSGLLKVASSASVVAPSVVASIIDTSGRTRLIPFRNTVGAVHEFSLLVPPGSYTLHVSTSAATFAGPDGTILPATGYTETINTALTTPRLQYGLTGRSEQRSTIVVLSTAAGKAGLPTQDYQPDLLADEVMTIREQLGSTRCRSKKIGRCTGMTVWSKYSCGATVIPK